VLHHQGSGARPWAGAAADRIDVVERHGGKLVFDTELGVGTTFHVWLPVVGRVVEARQVA
jgi:light-regulated signal transduction histidine kinase (bacteriophytochrome)